MSAPAADSFRCSRASLDDGELLAGTAPAESVWVFIEYAAAWGRKALAESRLPPEVRDHLAGDHGVRVQLIRRVGKHPARPIRVFTATFGSGARVETTELADPDDLVDLDLTGLAATGSAGLTSYADPLWLVCTNGSRDVCCAERGRPVGAALDREFPGQVWETTHLGGHRFAATALALPSGYVFGRLDPVGAIEVGRELATGRLPLPWCRGRAGMTPAAQVAELELRRRLDLTVLDAVVVTDDQEDMVRLAAGAESWEARMTSHDARRRQSCRDDVIKPAATWAGTYWPVTFGCRGPARPTDWDSSSTKPGEADGGDRRSPCPR
jgi:hypothetical protein